MDDPRAALERERASTLRRLAEMAAVHDEIVAASRDTNADDEHDPEGATIAFERAQVDALARRTRHHLDEVTAAVRRLDLGTYGTCEACGRAIPADRLTARPTARTCVACAELTPRAR